MFKFPFAFVSNVFVVASFLLQDFERFRICIHRNDEVERKKERILSGEKKLFIYFHCRIYIIEL